MTEGGGTCSLRAHETPNKLHTVGKPAPGHDIRLIDDAGKEVPSGMVGEVVGHSPAMMNAKLTWDQKTLNEYLAGPQKKVPGTKMGFPGFSDPSEEADVIAYLATLK